MSRSLLLALLPCLLVASRPRPALAIGPSAEAVFVLASPDGRPVSSGWQQLFREVVSSLSDLTSIPVNPEVREVPLRSLAEIGAPLVIIALDRLPAADATSVAATLRPFLSAGGTVWFVNGAVWNARDAASDWIHRVVAALRSGLVLVAIPPEAVVYRSFFSLDGPEVGQLEGARLDGRWAVLHAPLWTPTDQRSVVTARRRLAVNVVEYALCGDYKDEQTHLDYLLKRKRWKLD